jgi:peptide chain release factor 3
VEVLSRTDGELLAIFSDRWRLQSVERELPDAVLEALVVSV